MESNNLFFGIIFCYLFQNSTIPMLEASVSTILKVSGEGITIQGSCLTYFLICLINIV